MRLLAEFYPYLTGSVLRGTAGAQSDINLMLFSDDAKAVLLFLLKRNIEFEDGEWKVRVGGHEESVPSYTLTSESGVQTHIIVLPENARHSGSRHRRPMRILRRWRRCWQPDCETSRKTIRPF